MLASTDRCPPTIISLAALTVKIGPLALLSLAESDGYIAQFQGHFDAYSKAEGSRQKAEDHQCSFYHQDAKTQRMAELLVAFELIEGKPLRDSSRLRVFVVNWAAR